MYVYDDMCAHVHEVNMYACLHMWGPEGSTGCFIHSPSGSHLLLYLGLHVFLEPLFPLRLYQVTAISTVNVVF